MPQILTPRQRATLLAHVAGERPVKASDLVRLRSLAGRDLIKLVPFYSERPRSSRLTERGRFYAERIARRIARSKAQESAACPSA